MDCHLHVVVREKRVLEGSIKVDGKVAAGKGLQKEPVLCVQYIYTGLQFKY